MRELSAASPLSQAAQDLLRELEPTVSSGGPAQPQEVRAISFSELFLADNTAGSKIFPLYYDLFQRSFPDRCGRPTLDYYLHALGEGKSDAQILAYTVGGEIVGGRHLRILDLEDERFAVADFTWVSPSHRGSGFGTAIGRRTDELLRAQGVKFLVGEISDPQVISEEQRKLDALSGVSLEKRLSFWQRYGYLKLDAPYIQPVLPGREDPVRYLMFAYKPLVEGVSNEGMHKQKYLAVYHSMHGFIPNIEENESYLEIAESLKGHTFLRALALHQPRSRIQRSLP